MLPAAGCAACHALDIRALSLPEDHPDFDAALLQRFADWQQAFDLQSGPLAAFAVLGVRGRQGRCSSLAIT